MVEVYKGSVTPEVAYLFNLLLAVKKNTRLILMICARKLYLSKTSIKI